MIQTQRKQIRELDLSGRFAVKAETAMFAEQRPHVKVCDQKAEERQPAVQQRNSVMVCYYYGQEGHVRCDYSAWKGQQMRMRKWAKPQQHRNKPEAKFPTTWHNNQLKGCPQNIVSSELMITLQYFTIAKTHFLKPSPIFSKL